MAGNSSQTKIIGLLLLAIGTGLTFWGYQLSGSLESELTEAATGSDTDQVMTMYIGGAAAFVVGLYLFFKK
jgi:hypothetical protein